MVGHTTTAAKELHHKVLSFFLPTARHNAMIDGQTVNWETSVVNEVMAVYPLGPATMVVQVRDKLSVAIGYDSDNWLHMYHLALKQHMSVKAGGFIGK